MIKTNRAILSHEEFKAKARGYIVSRTKVGKSCGKATEEMLNELGVEEGFKDAASALITDVLHEIEAVKRREKSDRTTT